MIGGLSFEYAQARASARLAVRPDERLWNQLKSARSVAALVEAVRASPAAPIVSGISPTGDADAIELAFRQQLRTRIAEVAGWSPEPWREALLYTRHLVDLPAVVQLASDEAPPRWVAADPELARYALESPAQRHAALSAGPLAAVVAGLEHDVAAPRSPEPLARALRRMAAAMNVHRALATWEREWRRLWPRTTADEHSALEQLVRAIRAHVARFPALAIDEAATARQAFAARLATMMHRSVGQPAALFAYLAVFALDLERLRGEFVLRARPLPPPQLQRGRA
jgi:hypothetical protein